MEGCIHGGDQFVHKGVLGQNYSVTAKNENVPREVDGNFDAPVRNISVGNSHMGCVTANGKA
jgi:hypothetical protein